MSVVKISKKRELERLVAKLRLRLDRKVTQQEILDLCVELGEKNFEEIVRRLQEVPLLDDDKMKKILEAGNCLAEAPWQPLNQETFASEDDRDVYAV